MKREPIEELLARSLDETLTPSERERLNRGLEASAELRDLETDLRILRKLSTRDRVPETPVMAPRLQELVDQRYGKRFRVVPRRFFSSGMAWAALLVVGFGLGIWVSRMEGSPDAGRLSDVANEGALASIRDSVNQTRREYHQAIRQMETLAMQRLEHLPSAISKDLADHLAILDRAIQTCETLVEHHPGAYHAHFSLARAYQAKVDLLEKILET